MERLLRLLTAGIFMVGCFLFLNTTSCEAQTLYVYDNEVTTTPKAHKRPVKVIRPQTKPTQSSNKVSPIPYLDLVQKHALAFDLPPAFVLAVMRAESAFQKRAISRAGAKGLMQLMPVVIKAYKVKNAFDPDENIRGGCALLADLKRRHKGDVNKILGAYNAGSGNVRKKGGIPFVSTRKYAQKIVRYWAHYERLLGSTSQTQQPINHHGGSK